MWASVRALALLALAAFALGGPASPAAWAEERPAGWKNENTAFAYSFFGTGLPIAAGAYISGREGEADAAAVLFPIGAGFVFGPSLGHFYAGRSKRALVGIGIRSASVAAIWAGLEIHANSGSEAPGVATIGVLGGIAGISSMLADVFEASKSARIHNRELGKLYLSPSLIAGTTPGIRVDAVF